VFRKGREILAAFPSGTPRFYGGFAFSSRDIEEAPWPTLGASRFWIPRAEVIRRGEKVFLACNLFFRRKVELTLETVLNEWRSVVGLTRPTEDLPTLLCRRDHPDRSGWEANVRSALDLIGNGVLDKIVLARKAVYTFAVPVEASEILAVLKQVTSSCYHFLIQPEADVAFMGTPPECLYRRRERRMETEALAGTRPRVSDEEEDAAFARELLENPKERHEQELVRKDLLRQLHLFCETVESDPEPTVLRLERKQHLISRLSGRLREGVSDDEILRALHPTPAVGGAPRANALRELPRLEPFSRGWYAAPVGTFGADDAEFAVAIRSGLVHGRDVNVYSGAGIVAGSEPGREWQEIENKISDFVKVTRGRVR
jgi:menaquinone-specific isochorismate synthase